MLASKPCIYKTSGLDPPGTVFAVKRTVGWAYARTWSESRTRELVMKWKYYIPHVWNSAEDRTLWEDVWLLPEDGSNGGKSYWFTLNALSFGAAGIDGEYPEDPDDPLCGFGGSKLVREMNLRLLGDKDYFITPLLDMVARVEDFNMHELLEWTKLLIRVHLGDPEPELVKGDFEDFTGTNGQVSEIGRIVEAFAAGIPEDEIINYRTGDAEGPETPTLLTTDDEA